jgi:hypothetical protein
MSKITKTKLTKPYSSIQSLKRNQEKKWTKKSAFLGYSWDAKPCKNIKENYIEDLLSLWFAPPNVCSVVYHIKEKQI